MHQLREEDQEDCELQIDSMKMGDQASHVKMQQPMLRQFEVEEEKKEQQQPQSLRFLDSERDYNEIADAAQQAIEAQLKKYAKHRCSEVQLAAIE